MLTYTYGEELADSPGKIAFYDRLIVKSFFSAYIISMRCPEQHTKSPKKLVEEICLILINPRCVLITHGKNTPQKCIFFLYSYQNETLHNKSSLPMKSKKKLYYKFLLKLI